MVGHAREKTTQSSLFGALKKFALDYLIADTPPLTPGARWLSFVGALLGLLLAGIVVHLAPEGGLRFLPPMGASAIILFALPHSPLAQPWSVLGGCLAAAVSALLAAALPVHPLIAVALAVATTLWLMIRFRCLHPPGGALAMLIAIEGARPPLEALQLIGVVGANVIAMLLAAWVVNNLLLRWRYPQCRSDSGASLHRTEDLSPTERTGLSHEDLEHAVQAVGTFVDIQENELVRIYNLAVDHAFERHMAVSCGDVMARDIVTVTSATELEQAWNLLRRHKVKALPVVDDSRRIIGIVTVADFLRQLDDTTAAGLATKLQGLLRRTPGVNAEKARVVGQIMSTEVRTAREETPVAELVHQLSDRGLHHVPVVDEREELVGMVTQSDLIAALYRRIALASA